MEVNLESIESLDLSETERNVFKAIKESLQSPLDSEGKAHKIALDLQLLCTEADSPSRLSVVLSDLWQILLELAYLVPPDHSWQDTVVGAVNTLRKQGGEVKSGYQVLWKDLPGLSVCLNDNWLDPTLEPTGELTQNEILKWQNLNSFAARLTEKSFAPWLTFPIWQLRTALENPPSKGAAMDCRLWVASEWILRCGDVVLEDLISHEELNEDLATSLQSGPLCTNMPPLSFPRWKFWKRRFLEISANNDNLELDNAIYERILDTLRSMTVIEEQDKLLRDKVT